MNAKGNLAHLNYWLGALDAEFDQICLKKVLLLLCPFTLTGPPRFWPQAIIMKLNDDVGRKATAIEPNG